MSENVYQKKFSVLAFNFAVIMVNSTDITASSGGGGGVGGCFGLGFF